MVARAFLKALDIVYIRTALNIQWNTQLYEAENEEEACRQPKGVWRSLDALFPAAATAADYVGGDVPERKVSRAFRDTGARESVDADFSLPRVCIYIPHW